MAMLPKTPFADNVPITPHEQINDLPVHRATIRQIFHPVSESRHFTRVDAGRVFQRNLLPAEERIPHPELVKLQQLQQTQRMLPHESAAKLREMVKAKEDAAESKRREWLLKEDRSVRKIIPEGTAGRAEFRFRDIKVESVGKDGRAKEGVGARYGFPHEDRKKGIIKIPKKVEWNIYILCREVEHGKEVVLYNTIHYPCIQYSTCHINNAMYTKTAQNINFSITL